MQPENETLPPFLRGVPEARTYDGVKALLKSKALEAATHEESIDFGKRTILTIDGEEHFDRRRLESPMLSREALKTYERSILMRTVDHCLTDVERGPDGLPQCDLTVLIARMLLEIGATIVGLDDVDTAERSERLREVRDPMMRAFIVEFELAEHEPIIAEGLVAKEEFRKEFVEPARERRQAEIDALREAGDEAGLEALEGTSLINQMLLHWNPEWDDDLLVRESLLYLIASGHSTSTAITHAVNELSGWFDKHPEQWDLRLDPEFLTKAAQETLRLHSPTPGILRRAVEPVEIVDGDQVISLKPGDLISGNISAASRDESHFGEGWNEFDPHREVKRTTNRYGAAFGGGTHVCIGRQLVLGNYARGEQEGEYFGIFVRILRRLYEAGVRFPDGFVPVAAHSGHDRFDDFPVIFDDMDAVLGTAAR
jgi:cytochrome P450